MLLKNFWAKRTSWIFYSTMRWFSTFSTWICWPTTQGCHDTSNRSAYHPRLWSPYVVSFDEQSIVLRSFAFFLWRVRYASMRMTYLSTELSRWLGVNVLGHFYFTVGYSLCVIPFHIADPRPDASTSCTWAFHYWKRCKGPCREHVFLG